MIVKVIHGHLKRDSDQKLHTLAEDNDNTIVS